MENLKIYLHLTPELDELCSGFKNLIITTTHFLYIASTSSLFIYKC